MIIFYIYQYDNGLMIIRERMIIRINNISGTHTRMKWAGSPLHKSKRPLPQRARRIRLSFALHSHFKTLVSPIQFNPIALIESATKSNYNQQKVCLFEEERASDPHPHCWLCWLLMGFVLLLLFSFTSCINPSTMPVIIIVIRLLSNPMHWSSMGSYKPGKTTYNIYVEKPGRFFCYVSIIITRKFLVLAKLENSH